jgi:ParB family transcriptional regulator, chromosome partitioning protein
MATKRGGLGRGIGALIPQTDTTEERAVDVFFAPPSAPGLKAVPGISLTQLSPSDIVPNPHQPRREFRPEELAELTHSVREFGVLQPIVVRPRPLARPGDAPYELVMGERRLRAATAAGLSVIPAVVRETADDAMLRDALLENLHRADLNALEEASAYQQLLDDFGITQQELADRLGRSRPQVTNTLRLLKLPESVQAQVAAGVLSAGHARAILAADTSDAQIRLAADIVKKSLTVRQAEELAATADTKKKARASSRAGARKDQLAEIAERLGDRLNTRVSISLSKTKGTIAIEFASVQDLNRILGEMGVDGYGGETGRR